MFCQLAFPAEVARMCELQGRFLLNSNQPFNPPMKSAKLVGIPEGIKMG